MLRSSCVGSLPGREFCEESRLFLGIPDEFYPNGIARKALARNFLPGLLSLSECESSPSSRDNHHLRCPRNIHRILMRLSVQFPPREELLQQLEDGESPILQSRTRPPC